MMIYFGLIMIFGAIALKLYEKTPKGRGKIGEFIMSLLMKIMLNKEKYLILNNITLELSEKDTTQIDHIILSRYGIFVVEMKNYKGIIYGKAEEKTWTQSFGKGRGRNFKFQNPLLQNYKHTKAIADIFNVDPKKIYSIIVFSGLAKVKVDIGNVLDPISVPSYIKSKTSTLFSEEEIEKLKAMIKNNMLKKGKPTDIKHIENLNNRFGKQLTRGEAFGVFEKLKEEERIISNEKENKQTEKLFNALKQIRLDFAKKENIKAYMVFSDKVLMDLATLKPKTKEEMLKISGIGEIKYQKYGEVFLEEIINNKYKK